MLQLVTLLLTTWSLTFTLPSHWSGMAAECPLGCRDSSENPTPGVQLGSLVIVRHRQSPTWVVNADSINAQIRRGSQALLAQLQPTIRAEADWTVYAVVPITSAEAGRVRTVAISDSSHGWWYGVAARDSAGHRACVIREVWR